MVIALPASGRHPGDNRIDMNLGRVQDGNVAVRRWDLRIFDDEGELRAAQGEAVDALFSLQAPGGRRQRVACLRGPGPAPSRKGSGI